MIEQKDIDRLLAGRKIVDDYRAVAEIYREKVAVSNTKTATEIAATKEQYGKREDATKKMHEELYKLGFGAGADPSAYDAFNKVNAQMIMEEYTEVTTISFLGCNKCPTRKCVELYGAGACGNQNVKDIKSVERDMRLFFLKLIKKSKDGLSKNFADVKVCPDGYGFQWKRNRNERFNLGWE